MATEYQWHGLKDLGEGKTSHEPYIIHPWYRGTDLTFHLLPFGFPPAALHTPILYETLAYMKVSCDQGKKDSHQENCHGTTNTLKRGKQGLLMETLLEEDTTEVFSNVSCYLYFCLSFCCHSETSGGGGAVLDTARQTDGE